jgi:branched-chain amino acid transport system permease protein
MTIAFLALLLTVPLFANSSVITIMNVMAINIIAVFGLYILTGLCGQLSVGHAAFVALGAFTTAILATRFGLGFWLTIPCAGLVAGLVGVIFGLPSARIKGFYLAMATVAAQFIIIWLIKYPLTPITGGMEGLMLPPAWLGVITLDTPGKLFYLIIPVTIIMGLIAKNIARTRVGRAFVAIRDNDLAANVMGINIYYYKILAFFTGCFFAGVAGSLWSYYMLRVVYDQFTFSSSILYLGMLVVGGLGSSVGAIIGPIVIVALQELVNIIAPMIGAALPAISVSLFAGLARIFYGVVIVLFLVFEPRGINHQWEIFKASYRLHPFAH